MRKQSPSFKKKEQEHLGVANWNPPPCKCHAPVQVICNQLRCSQCGVQWDQKEPVQVVYAGRDGFTQGNDFRKYVRKDIKK